MLSFDDRRQQKASPIFILFFFQIYVDYDKID